MKNIKLKLIACIVVALANNLVAQVPENLLKAIHQVETGGRFGPIKGDNGAALGPFQIHHAYWRDAVEFDKSIGGRYTNCSDYDYSVKVINAYIKRYAKNAVAMRDWEKIARIHNGGPAGKNNKNTLGYWKKVEACLNKD